MAGSTDTRSGDSTALDQATELVEHLPGSEAAADVEALARVVLDLKAKLEAIERRLSDDIDDPDALAEAIRRTPSLARLKAGIGKYPPPEGDFGAGEEMPY